MLESVRDIAIVVLALESIVIGAVLIITLLQLRSLTRLLQEQIAPMLDTAGDTATIVKGTADFVSDSLVQPTIRAAAFVAGAKKAAQSLFGSKTSV